MTDTQYQILHTTSESCFPRQTHKKGQHLTDGPKLESRVSEAVAAAPIRNYSPAQHTRVNAYKLPIQLQLFPYKNERTYV